MAIPNGWIYGDCGCCCTTTTTVEDDCDCSDGGTGVTEIIVVELVSDMAAFEPYTGLKQFNVLGYLVSGDGLGGIWTYVQDSTATGDGYSVIVPPGGVGRYVKWV